LRIESKQLFRMTNWRLVYEKAIVKMLLKLLRLLTGKWPKQKLQFDSLIVPSAHVLLCKFYVFERLIKCIICKPLWTFTWSLNLRMARDGINFLHAHFFGHAFAPKNKYLCFLCATLKCETLLSFALLHSHNIASVNLQFQPDTIFANCCETPEWEMKTFML
jgi:hypothetical protein